MKIVMLFLVFGMLASCINSKNSFTGDALLQTELGIGASALAQGQCISCHEHSHWADYTTNQEFINELKGGNNEIVPGNAEASGMYIRISGGADGYDVMPQGSTGVDPDVKELFKTWIDSMVDKSGTTQ